MATYIQPLNNLMLVLPDPKRTKTAGGIEIPDSANEMGILIWGTVKRVSKKVEEIKAGDRVYFPQAAGTPEEIDGVGHKWLQEGHIWGVEVELATVEAKPLKKV